MDPDIELYINSSFAGFFPFDQIAQYIEEYRDSAYELAQYIDWDEGVLYAIFSYDDERETITAIDLMNLRMSYEVYRRLGMKLAKKCRLFFFNNSKEIYYEN